MPPSEKRFFDLVREHLQEDYVPEQFRNRVNSPFCGHCHHATIAMYYLLGGKDLGYRIRKAVDELDITHYWLETKDGEVIDPTAEQYTDLSRRPPYEDGVSKGVSYRKTKAALRIIDEVQKIVNRGRPSRSEG